MKKCTLFVGLFFILSFGELFSQGSFNQGEIYLLSRGFEDIGSGIKKISDEGASIFIDFSVDIRHELSYDSYRDMLLIGFGGIVGIKSNKETTLIYPTPFVDYTPGKNGLIYVVVGRGIPVPLNYIDAENTIHPFIGASNEHLAPGDLPYVVNEMFYDKETNSLFLGGVYFDNLVEQIFITKIPLSEDGTQILDNDVSKIKYLSIDVSPGGAEGVSAISYGPLMESTNRRKIFVLVDTNTGNSEPRIMTFDPLNFSNFSIFANTGPCPFPIGGIASNRTGLFSITKDQSLVYTGKDIRTFEEEEEGAPIKTENCGTILLSENIVGAASNMVEVIRLLPESDTDGDGIADSVDNCPNDSNPNQEDDDGDGIGNSCDICPNQPSNIDADGDSFCVEVDCNDTDPLINPDATEIPCNRIDENCDGQTDEGSVGMTCNDNDVCTINDVYQADCSCAGTFQDTDNDGTCDAEDLCPSGLEPGSTCDDNNANTVGETVLADCTCGNGTILKDCPTLQKNIGDTCDDDNPNTINDSVQSDCTCVGTTDNSSDAANCENLQFNVDNGQIIVSGLTAAREKIKIINHDNKKPVVLICNNDCNDPHVISDLQSGVYRVQVQMHGSNGSYCYREEEVTVSDCIDSDQDGTCDDQDQCNGTAEPGTSCDDGDEVTKNDRIQPDCSCKGELSNANALCNDFQISIDNGKLVISNLTAPIEVLDLFNNKWKRIYTCSANCGEEEIIKDLAKGKYHLTIKAYSAAWKYICQKKITFKITSSGIQIVNGSRATFPPENPLVSPNPATNQVNIQLANFVKEKGQIRLINAFGKEMYYLNFEKIPGETIPIDLKNWTNGVYFVQIKIENRPAITRKLIINRTY